MTTMNEKKIEKKTTMTSHTLKLAR